MRSSTPIGEFFLILLAFSLVAVLLHFAFRHPRLCSDEARSKPADTVQAVIGGMFALSMAFLANAIWTTDDRARDAVNSEAHSIRLMHIYAYVLDAAPHERLDGLVASYAKAAALEWNDMNEGRASKKAEQQLEDIYRFVLGGLPPDGPTPLLQQRLLVTLEGLSAARQQRLSISQEIVREWQWFLVIGLALVLLVTVATVHAARPAARARALAVMVTALTVMFFVVATYQRPFSGAGALTPAPILEAAKALR